MKFCAFILLVLFVYTIGFSQDNSAQDQIRLMAERANLSNAVISATAIDIDNNNVVMEYNGNRNLVPASSMKIISSFAALYLLGENYQYKTDLSYSGNILPDGTLEGNIYIIGSGDPSLGSRNITGSLSFSELLKKWVESIKKVGIRCVAGNIIADESVFNSFPVSPSWQWNDLGNYYASGTWGINIHDNLYYVYFQQTKKQGGYPRLEGISPYVPNLKIDNEVTTGTEGSGDNAYIFGGPYEYNKRIVGTIPPGEGQFIIKGAIPDPPTFLAYHLKEKLEDNGIQTTSYSRNFLPDKIPFKKHLIHRLVSPSLASMVKHTNFKSDNLVSETLLKSLGKEIMKEGSGEAGKKVIHDFINSLGLEASKIRIEDGSGLSSRNKVSSIFLAQFLKRLVDKHGIDEIIRFLPRAGVEGTIRGLFKQNSAKGNIWAKSGSMDDILSYAGLIHSKSGKWYSFSIIVNAYTVDNKLVRPLLEDLMISIYELSQ